MSNESIFITEMEAKRIKQRRIKKIAWKIKIISMLLFFITIFKYNNSSLPSDNLMVILLIISVIGLYIGYILHSQISHSY